MESLLEHPRTPALLVAVAVFMALVWWWLRRRKEGFQDAPATPTQEEPIQVPTFKQEDCKILKKTMDAFRLMDVSPRKEAGKSENVQVARSHIDDQYKQLNCDDYFARLAAGKIEAPKTDVKNRPLPPLGATA